MRMLMVPILGLTLAIELRAQKADPAEVQFKAAQHKQNVDGDLKAAIDQYRKVVARAGSNRDLAARALLQLGDCYEKLGDTEARKAYEQVIRDFGDRTDATARARARLATLVRSSDGIAGIRARRVWAGSGVDGSGSVSADGRYLTYINWDTGDLAIRDLTTGQNRMLTDKGPWSKSNQFADMPVMSRDSKQIAYVWENESGIGYELRVMNRDGSGIRTLTSSKLREWIRPYAWSGDGKFIVAVNERGDIDQTTRIVRVNVNDGAVKVLKVLDGGRYRHDRMALSGDSRYLAYSRPAEKRLTERDIYLLNIVNGTETAIMTHPADEAVLGWTPDGKHVIFSSTRLNPAGAWILPINDGKVSGPPELAKGDLGSVTPLGITSDGSLFYQPTIRGPYNSVEVYTAPMDPTTGRVTGPQRLLAKTFTGTASAPFWSPDGRSIAYRVQNLGGTLATAVTIRDVASGDEQTFTAIQGMPRGWSPDGSFVVLQGRPDQSDKAQGAYKMERNGQTTPLAMRSKDGLLTFPNLLSNGKTLVFVTNRIIRTRDLETGNERTLYQSPRSLTGLALSPGRDKIAFSSGPSIFTMGLEASSPREIFKLADPDNESFAFSSVTWQTTSHVIFSKHRNRGKSELWRVPATGGQPEDLGLTLDDIHYVSVSPKGDQVAFCVGANVGPEIWALENFLPAGR